MKLKAGTKQRVAPPRLDDEWRRWIAENLLQGAGVDQLRAHLVQRGCPLLVANAEIAEAQASPYLRGAALLNARLEKRDWLLRSYGALAALDGGIDAVARVSGADPAHFFTNHYVGHRPVLVEGLLAGWPALGWTFDRLAERFGAVEIEVQEGRERDPAYEINMDRLRTRRPFGEVAARIAGGSASNDYYVTANNGGHNRAALDPLWNELGPLPGLLADGGEREGFFWMGPRGTITPFHHDLTNNLLVQFVGTKRVTLVPSWEAPRMRNHVHCYSQWSGPAEMAAAPDGERPHMIGCDLGPGEALFIPVGWWHHVEALTPTIGMSFTAFARPNDHHSDYRSFGAL